ncbi:MAG: dienelactone hydrolase family protein [Acidobacteriota bacterium]
MNALRSAVGHALYVFNDPSRPTTDSLFGFPLEIPRPVPAYIFYPVDPDTITDTTPEAVYPLDPMHNFIPILQTYSSEWEEQEIDPAFQEAPPSNDGPFPLVIVSHGWGGHAWSMLYLGTRLASHGFVVALVYHYGDAYWGWEEYDDLGWALVNRPKDVSFALTNILEKNETEGQLLRNTIDPEKIAASGFSFGGYVAAALAGGDDWTCDSAMEDSLPMDPASCAPVPPDPRIRAIVTLDGAHHFLKFAEMSRITVPTMVIGEEWEAIPSLNLPNSWQARLHSASRGRPSYRVDITGTDHSAFSNSCESIPVLASHFNYPDILVTIMQNRYCAAPLPAPEVKRLITKYTVAFLKTNLSGKPGYQSVLTPGHALTRESMVEFFVTEKRNPNSIDEDWPDYFIFFEHQPGSEKSKAFKDPLEVPPMPFEGFDIPMESSQ